MRKSKSKSKSKSKPKPKSKSKPGSSSRVFSERGGRLWRPTVAGSMRPQLAGRVHIDAGRIDVALVAAVLMDAAMAHAQALGTEAVELAVRSFNREAIAFYEALGFAPEQLRMRRPVGTP